MGWPHAAAAMFLLVAACSLPAQSGERGACPIAGSSDWWAGVDAMPGPRPPRLIVTGKVTTPSGGYRLALERGPVQEIDPPVQQVNLVVRPPSGGATDALVVHEVRGEFPALERYGAVTISCSNTVLADIRNVGRAH